MAFLQRASAIFARNRQSGKILVASDLTRCGSISIHLEKVSKEQSSVVNYLRFASPPMSLRTQGRAQMSERSLGEGLREFVLCLGTFLVIY